MEIQRPLAVVTPTLDGDILTILARARKRFTTGELHRLIPQRSREGIRLTVQRLVDQGIVESESAGRAVQYRLNTDHLAAASVIALSDQKAELLDRISTLLETWEIKPVYAAVFGSAARGDMRPDSDIDIFVVRPAEHDRDDDDLWANRITELGNLVTRWTGNDARVLGMTPEDVHQGVSPDPVLLSIVADGISVAGPTNWLRDRLRRQRMQNA